jgi:AmmeMemoRadiSam system protein B
MSVRRASAWGFHPFDRDGELSEVKRCFMSKHGVGKLPEVAKNGERGILGAVVPHAGISISGPTAGYTYHSLAKDGAPSTFVIFGVSHRGYPGFSAMLEGVWRMPLGDVEVDSELAKAVVKNSEFVDVNPSAHSEEHSIEVQLPFLQFLYDGNFKFAPMLVGFGDYEMCENVGKATAKAVKELGRDAVILGSTDFTHYGSYYGYAPVGMEPFENALNWMRNADMSMIDAILSLDGEKLVGLVQEKGYTMCGYLPVATMLAAAKELGAKKAKLLKYGTSYEVTGSKDLIVGYGSIVVLK